MRQRTSAYAWPAYVANLPARHRCPVCLLVVTVEESVARWAGRCIELGPGTRCCPWVRLASIARRRRSWTLWLNES